jgi:hypothetical protein
MFKHNNLIGFTMKAILAIIGLALVWTFIAPYYNRLLVAAADRLVLGHFSFNTDYTDIYAYSATGAPLMGIHGAALHFSLILLLALLITTPGYKIINRLRNIGIGLAVMFVFHQATLILLARLMQSGGGISTPSLNFPVVMLSTIGFNLVPPLVWVGLCLRQWLGGEFKKRSPVADTLQSG